MIQFHTGEGNVRGGRAVMRNYMVNGEAEDQLDSGCNVNEHVLQKGHRETVSIVVKCLTINKTAFPFLVAKLRLSYFPTPLP
jgi:hypothetical protein